jgi:tetratricopeptide (TPR) repeat protein
LNTDLKSDPISFPESIADRYRVEDILGKGGAAVVYRVYDTYGKRELALKQLLTLQEVIKQGMQTELFEREYHTLAQLAHPRVIEVYDYGVDERGLYYTMELLQGGDLRELSPLPWNKTCSILRDVCSALSLLHSRRLVHRDLSPRNIRCTRNGLAKLIDFGAMVPMGPCKQIVGTPQYIPPEVMNLQTLDARSDLFSLGATAYRALTGRHPYPARSFAALRNAWRSRPQPPSQFVPDIPKELDELVMSLIAIDLKARPVNAAEVMERLSVIAGLQIDEQLVVSKAYLSTPTLVGRDEPLLRVRKQTIRALRGRGGAEVILGVSGTGRSRFLDACILEGKLAGAAVLRADGRDARAGDYGAVRAMAAQLLDVLPEKALKAAEPYLVVIGHILPELLEATAARQEDLRTPQLDAVADGEAAEASTHNLSPDIDEDNAGQTCKGNLSPSWNGVWGKGHSSMPPSAKTHSSISPDTFEYPRQLRSQIQAGLRDWLLKVSQIQHLMIAVDDIDRIDEPSAALVALLAEEASKYPLVVAVTSVIDDEPAAYGALKLLLEAGATIELSLLDVEQTAKLLGSVFGEVNRLRLVVDKLHALSGGNPRTIMQLAQHLVDVGVVRYQSGTWVLPRVLDTSDLPGSFTEALEARLRTLSKDARSLAETLALSPDRSFSSSECKTLTEHQDPARLHRALNELVEAQVLSTDGQSYAFMQQGWITALVAKLDKERELVLHRRVAEVFERRGTDDFRLGQHLMIAGDVERGLDKLVDYCEQAIESASQRAEASPEIVRYLPADYFDTLSSAIDVCQSVGRPPRETYILRRGLFNFATAIGSTNSTHFNDLFEQLVHESGLDFWKALGDSVPAEERLATALASAQKRYDEAPESARGLHPVLAIEQLAQVVAQAASNYAWAFDYPLWQSLPSLAPLASISPALNIVDKLVKHTGELIGGRYELAIRGFTEILERLAEPDHAGLDGSRYTYARLGVMYALALMQSSIGLRSALAYADEIEVDPLHQVNAWKIRMVFHLYQGDTDQAREYRKRAELLQIQNSPAQFYEGTSLYTEMLAYARYNDLTGVKQTIDSIQRMAESFPGWVPVLHLALGEYQRIRGDYPSAVAEYEQVLSTTEAGKHLCWPHAAGFHLSALLELGRLSEVKALGEERLEIAEKAGQGYWANLIRMPLALAEAKLHQYPSAIQRSETAVTQSQALGVTGIYLCLACENRARVAILMRDQDSFQTHAAIYARQYQAGRTTALTAGYEKLMRDAREADLEIPTELTFETALPEDRIGRISSVVAETFKACSSPEQRAERSLEMLIRQSSALSGYLYTIQKSGPVLVAKSGDVNNPDAALAEMVRDYLSAELDYTEQATITRTEQETITDVDTSWIIGKDEEYFPLLLSSRMPEGVAIAGLALLRKKPGEALRIPYETALVLSKTLLEVGDVVIRYAAS